MKQKIETEVDIPDGYEFLRYGVPADGESFIGANGGGVLRSAGYCTYPRFIIREAWQWPPWLTADYIARAKVERWYAFTKRPTIGVDVWYIAHGDVCCLSSGMFDFNPPPCDDWTKSLRVRPGVKQ